MTRIRFANPNTRLAAIITVFATAWLLAFLWCLPSHFHVGAFQSSSDSTDGVWRVLERTQLTNQIAKEVPSSASTFALDAKALTRALNTAQREAGNSLDYSQTFLQLPLPGGEYLKFRLEESPVLDASLMSRFPEIKSYRGIATDNPAVTMRADWTPQGFHALILTPEQTYSIHPVYQGVTNEYVSYDAGTADKVAEEGFQCLTEESKSAQTGSTQLVGKLLTVGPSRRNYRLAIATTWEYCNFYGGGTVAGTVASLNTWVNALNAIYERDLNIHFNLVDAQSVWFSTDQGFNSGNDPFTNGNALSMLSQGRPTLRDFVGSTNYDIGHTLGYLSNGGGGVAWLGVACNNADIFTNTGADGLGPAKGGGISNISGTAGNASYLNVVAHELGHQFGAPHSFNGTTGNCGGGNRSANSSVEPGSGTSIMSYAGLCSSDNVVSGSSLRFHAWSFAQITNYVTANACASTTSTGNNAPTINGGSDYAIPRLTPFQLTATTATDPDAADIPSLTYAWEQVDVGGSNFGNPPYTDQNDTINGLSGSTRPLFRSYAPTATATRIFPALNYILNNANTPPPTTNGFQTAESLSHVNRKLRFRLLARDQRGGVADDEVLLTVDANAGPFLVTAPPNTPTTWTGGQVRTVMWSVNNTNAASINCENVRILLSTDGGATFPTTLANSTLNDGSENITVPNGINSTTARVRVEAVGNIFFDISDTNFTITPGINCPQISIAPATALNGFIGLAYNQGLTASGGTPLYSFAVSTGALPNGLILSTAGVLSGTPTAIGVFDFTVRAMDANGCAGTKNYSVTIIQKTNLALNQATAQSSMGWDGAASRAVDGNTNGNYSANPASVTHTQIEAQPWWQVDLGSIANLNSISIWNRTDCCSDRLSNFYVFVSDVPFTSTNLNATLSQIGVSNYFTAGPAGTTTNLVINRTGRYIRVQLADTNALSLAEVQIMGTN